MKDGKVYAWGLNDEGQMGLGDLFGDHIRWVKEQAEEAE